MLGPNLVLKTGLRLEKAHITSYWSGKSLQQRLFLFDFTMAGK